MTNKCKCSLAISLNGDGCRYCQPQEYIDRLASDNKVLHKHHEAMIRRAKRTLAIMNEGFER